MFSSIKYALETTLFIPYNWSPKKVVGTSALLSIGATLVFTAVRMAQSARQMSESSSTWGALRPLISALEAIENLSELPSTVAKALLVGAATICAPQLMVLRAYTQGSKLKEKIDGIEAQGSPDWQEKSIKAIRQSRENLPIPELSRLIGARVLIDELPTKIDSITTSGHAKVMIAQAFEIQKVFKSTHYVFIHAQRLAYYPIATIYKQLAKTDAKDSSHFKFIRKNETTDPKRTIKDFNSGSMVKDTDPAVSKDLISCTANFLDNSYAESALFFLQLNLNVLDQNNSDAVAIRNTGMLSYTESDKIAAKIPPSPTGNLLVFCIPKNKIDEIAYRAHPLGTACKCFTPDQQKVILDRWQQGISNKEDSCSDKTGTQYRIFLPAFRKESGCRLYYLTPHAKPIRTKIKQAAKEALIRSKL